MQWEGNKIFLGDSEMLLSELFSRLSLSADLIAPSGELVGSIRGVAVFFLTSKYGIQKKASITIQSYRDSNSVVAYSKFTFATRSNLRFKISACFDKISALGMSPLTIYDPQLFKLSSCSCHSSPRIANMFQVKRSENLLQRKVDLQYRKVLHRK